MHGTTGINMGVEFFLFSTLMFMPVVPAIRTRNKRHCSRFRNSVSLACWS